MKSFPSQGSHWNSMPTPGIDEIDSAEGASALILEPPFKALQASSMTTWH
ncbi:hypothetical protein FVEG_15422 [Fusarium verticillioides 7600]|uniref:Uncharacterized protein n=1 Tax=Gibberella moniliformis (strain M3125 / FGSC 7600) TaxID=334819 RepID=W7M484_GIBM7|nr:hypothetical protein FVEG_15422 [Fusarium verticillioides 7600]EWG42339.1 hypothetical protein FVEG_15422 [Fusarium verticillioides 7600]